MRIAADRPADEPLVAALRRHAEAGATRRRCEDARPWSAGGRSPAPHGPFGFYATLLGPEGGRAALVARLGGEAGDAVDAVPGRGARGRDGAGRALPHHLPRPLRGIGREESGHTVQRDLDAGRDEVRVMTVHGSKGLEAPIVILLDGCDVREREPPWCL